MLDVAILAALDWERRAVTEELGAAPGERPYTWRARLADGASCLIMQTGMGLERARAAAAAVPPARLLLGCGCAGGLVDWLRPGDLIAAESVMVVDAGGRPREELPARGDALATWAAGRGIRIHLGRIASSPVLLGTAEARTAGAETGALIIEMENGAHAAEARARAVPFVGLRVVLDLVGQTLPPLDMVDEATGEVRARRAVVGLARRPWLWPAVGRLALQARVADRRLRAVMAALRAGGIEALAGAPQSTSAAAG